EFKKYFKEWLVEDKGRTSMRERIDWVKCLLSYIEMDTNGNGIPDWSAIIDERPSRILFPEDEDIDGDGIINVLDARPFNVDSSIPNKGVVPLHLRAEDSLTAIYQEIL